MRTLASLFSGLLLVASCATASAADPVLAPGGQSTLQAQLAFGKTVSFVVEVPAGEYVLLRGMSDAVDLRFDVSDGDIRYESDSPAFYAGTEYLSFEPRPATRRVEVVLRSDAHEGGSGGVSIELLAADASDAAIAGEWASLSRDRPPARNDATTQARVVRLDALRAACATAQHPRCTPDAHLALGALQESVDAIDAVIPNFEAAIAGYATLGAPLGEIAARRGVGLRLRYAGDMAQSEAAFRQCITLAKQHGLTYREAQFEDELAVMHQYAGDLDAALAHYANAEKALGGVRVPLAGRMRSNIGGVYELRGDAERALAAYQEAVDFAGDDPEQRLERAMALSNLGALRADLGQKQEAVTLLAEALAEFRALDSMRNQARMLAILGYQYDVLGRPAIAEPLLRATVTLCKRREDVECSAFAYRALSQFLRRRGKAREDEAVAAYAEAERLTRASNNSYSKAMLLPDLADFQRSRGDLAAAAATVDSVLEDPALQQMVGTAARARMVRGQVLAARGDTAAARAEFVALADHTELQTYPIQASRVRLDLARLDAKEGKWADVERRTGEEIDSIGKVRQEFFDPLRRADYLSVRQDAFELLIRAKLARAAGGDAAALREAFDVDERSRSRGLLDALASEDAAARSGNPDLLAARNTLRLKQGALLQKEATATAADAAALDALRSEVAMARVALEAAEAQRDGNSRRAALAEPHTIDDVQAQLAGPHQAVLMYRLREQSSWAWVVTRDALARVELPARDVLEPRIDAFVAALREGRDAEADGRWLYDTLVGSAKLPDAVTQVLIVPDGPLQRLPFVALTAPDGRFLIESLQLSMLPSASVGIALAEARRMPRDYPAQDVVVFADPVFALDDPRVRRTGAETVAANEPAASLDEIIGADLSRSGRGIESLVRLPGTAREADAMQAAFGHARTRVFSGFDATLDAARGDVSRNARILHFATHGLVDPLVPERTGLALTRWEEQGTPAGADDGFLNLPMIGDLRFNAELVILSACDTAIGREVEGEGLIGVSRGFLAAGAESVIATLWPVSDRDAAKLDAVLAKALQSGAPPAEALRTAQRDAIADPQRRRPRSWAAFGFYGALEVGDSTY